MDSGIDPNSISRRLVHFFVSKQGEKSSKPVQCRWKFWIVFTQTYSPQYWSDERTKDWFLASTPGPLFMILVTYLYFCCYAGPAFMKNRKPYDLKNILIVYNFVQVLFSAYLVYEVSEDKR